MPWSRRARGRPSGELDAETRVGVLSRGQLKRTDRSAFWNHDADEGRERSLGLLCGLSHRLVDVLGVLNDPGGK